MKILSVKESREIDNYTINNIGIPGIVLMENAGLSVFQMIDDYIELDKINKILIISGKGNNGGDGFVVARHFFAAGKDVSVILLGKYGELKGDALTEFNIIRNLGLKIKEFKGIEQIKKEIKDADVVIDGIFGTGFKGKPDKTISDIIRILNSSGKSVFSIDIPSCVDGDNGNVSDVAVKAVATCTMGFIKKGMLFYPGRDYAGEIYVGDIGIPPKVAELFSIKTELLDNEYVRKILPIRFPYSHKGTYGKVIVFAGSPGLTGAATLTSKSALRAGAGLVYLAMPKSLTFLYETKLTEVVKIPIEDNNGFYKYSSAIKDMTKDMDVLIIGPGIGKNDSVADFVKKIIREYNGPIVIDADGINNITTDDLKYSNGKWILTPHPGEFSRLTGMNITDIENNRLDVSIQFATEYNVILVLKGVPTVIATSDGKAFVNSTGNSGLSSGGSGDVLTGLIGGFLAQGINPENAAICGVYIHGLAADIAISENETEYSLIASDLLKRVGKGIKKVLEDVG